MVNNFFLGGEVLEILISYHSKVPIYEQILKQISNKILSVFVKIQQNIQKD